jgi:hypothetical protein
LDGPARLAVEEEVRPLRAAPDRNALQERYRNGIGLDLDALDLNYGEYQRSDSRDEAEDYLDLYMHPKTEPYGGVPFPY